VAIALFVLIGRSSHDEAASLAGYARTAWPFFAGAALGWLGCRGWRRPLEVFPTGVVVWVATVVAGMLLRLASGQGVAGPFILVAAVVLGFLLLGWRALVDSITWVRGQHIGGRGRPGRRPLGRRRRPRGQL